MSIGFDLGYRSSKLKFGLLASSLSLTILLAMLFLLKEYDSHENIFIPVGTAIINVADVKYALVFNRLYLHPERAGVGLISL